MYTPDAQGSRAAAAPSRRLVRTIGGVALMVIGVALMAWGAHHLTENGNCSSTGYVSYGPVPTCKGNEFFYITSAFFLGPAVALVGWGMAKISGLMWPLTCVGYAVGFITIRNDAGPTSGAKAFGQVMGEFLIALAVLSVIITVRKRLRKKAGHAGATNAGATNAGAANAGAANAGAAPAGITLAGIPPTGSAGPAFGSAGLATTGPATVGPAPTPVASMPPSWGPPVTQAATGSGSDPYDKIAKLAQLHQTGAITDAEFEREKAKLLGEI
jgi:hypothetical protein